MKAFKCPNCENSYNRAQDLKAHQTRAGHKNEQQVSIVENIDLSSLSCEELFNSEMDPELCDSTQESEAVYITRPRRPRVEIKPEIKNVQDKSV